MVLSAKMKLALISALMLFTQLVLIRWLGANVIYLGFFSNFVLLGSFLGLGLGFIRSNDKPSLYPWFPVAAGALIAFVALAPVEINRSQRDLIYFGGDPQGLPPWVVLPIIFLAVAGIMTMIGDGVSRLFARFEPLDAYRLDVLGSIAGILAFTAMSFLSAPPVVWALVLAAATILTLEPPIKMPAIGGLAVVVMVMGVASFLPNLSWSPYYMIETQTDPDDPLGAVSLSVNNIPHQVIVPYEERLRLDPIYNNPYELREPQLDKVLVIGAGTGNDVALALGRGAKHVDAVEIDPRIQEIGADQNPDQPFQDPRVDVHINDGRAFLQNTDEKYDLIILALPDSLTLVSGQSALRLESYLFTREAVEEMREHLTEDGMFSMYNVYRELWLRDRYAGTVNEVFGHEPCVTTLDAAAAIAVISTTIDGTGLNCPQTWQPVADFPEPATDDRPFPYLQTPTVPTIYLIALGLIIAAALILVRIVGGPLRGTGSYLDLFFMGVAFLLLGTKSVVQFALLFGTTWLVNALVFAGILLSVYCAVELARHVKLPPPVVLYGALLAALAAAWFVPLDALLPLTPPLRLVAGVVLAFAPIFIANLLFAQRFAQVSHSTTAFGANLIGAMVGGCIEYAALITGYRGLLILVAIFYGAAFLFGRLTWMRADRAAATSSEPVPAPSG